MANQLPEVLPQVISMPTTGWLCQTGGKARRRIAANSSPVDTEGIYDVKGVPGFTHNSSAVISVDADYTKYRDANITVPANVWNEGDLQFPAGLLTDSEEPDNADERYDRAIERCVGYISLFPENCTGHIREPTRSISEIRTLVAPKSRLETLTYNDEMGGWRIPVDAEDEKRECDALVSSFPDIKVSVLPRTSVRTAILNKAVHPSSLYIDSDTGGRRFRVDYLAAAAGTIGYIVGTTTVWDNCITLSWDPDRRLYRSKKELTVVLHDVKAVTKSGVGAGTVVDPTNGYTLAAGAVIADAALARHRLIVTFPVLETTRASDGYCWISSMHDNENALGFVTRQEGGAIAKKIEVQVIGKTDVQGPFYWVGMPALRIPVGGTFAFPGPDILAEQFGDGEVNDVQHNFYDKFQAFTPVGLMRYHWKQQTAGVAVVTDESATQTAQLALNFALRSVNQNSGLFLPRPGGFQKHLCDKQDLVNFEQGEVRPYSQFANAPTVDQVVTTGIKAVLYDYKPPADRLGDTNGLLVNFTGDRTIKTTAINAQAAVVDSLVVAGGGLLVSARAKLSDLEEDLLKHDEQKSRLEAIRAQAHTQSTAATIDPFLQYASEPGPGPAACFQRSKSHFAGSTTFTFSNEDATYRHADSFWLDAAGATHVNNNNFVSVACTPLMFAQEHDNRLNLDDAGVGAGIPSALFVKNARCFMDLTDHQNGKLACNFDFTNTLSTERGLTNAAPPVEGHRFFAAGYSFLLGRTEGGLESGKSNLTALYTGAGGGNIGEASLGALRQLYANGFAIGNKFNVPRADFDTDDEKVGGVDVIANLKVKHIMFATSKPVKGVIFVSPAIADRKHMFIVTNPVTSAIVNYTPAGGAAAAYQAVPNFLQLKLGRPKTVSANNGALIDVPTATLTAIKAIVGTADPMEMYVLHDSFCEKTQLFGGGPFQEDLALVRSKGAVFQSVKRISQHVCGPILNPNARIGAVAPLNYDSRHLPPELRDFRLQLYDIDWSRLQATKTTLNEITIYEFQDGIQKVGAQPNVLYLPQFRETTVPVSGNTFDVEIFSELGAPSYFCLFCRHTNTDILQQPQIRQLSIFNSTTKKKSNVVSELSISQLYHLTQRNVHPAAQYDKHRFRRRQTILLKTEDIGLLGLDHNQYQSAKRVKYSFSGTIDDPGQLYIIMVYNNRGLHIDGRRLQLVTLHE